MWRKGCREVTNIRGARDGHACALIKVGSLQTTHIAIVLIYSLKMKSAYDQGVIFTMVRVSSYQQAFGFTILPVPIEQQGFTHSSHWSRY